MPGFAHDYAIILDEMPELKTYTRKGPTGLWDKMVEKHSFVAYPTFVEDDLTISSESRIESIAVYNPLGMLVKELKIGGNRNSAAVSFSGFAPGVYIVKVDRWKSLKVVKE